MPLPGPWSATLLALCVLGCLPGRDRPLPLQQGLAGTIAALPWDSGPPGWDAFCGATSPCDSLLVEPRVVRLPTPPPAFFVPAVRPRALDLSALPSAEFRLAGRPTRFADWGECLDRRHDPTWRDRRVACVALGIAAGTGDTVLVAVLAITPSGDLLWPRLRLLAGERHWQVQRVSIGGG